MRKLKIYLDTSVISHMDVTDRTDWMSDTRKLWEDIKSGKFDVYVSETLIEEIGRCKPEKLAVLTKHLNEIEYSVIKGGSEIAEIVEKIIEMGILKPKSLDDCVHIATAVVGGCDVIVSWNFKHMVNIKTIKGVRAITNLGNYGNIDIVAPTTLLESED